ncbi:non-homologous end-joining DNA ligase [Nonomuraea cavernae]|uniref:DNA ligase (ATP) n=1 Tax=Nonomuraea cavernae TaxID=2045107 RepID=A0A917ZIG1_9ACTN|nr:non-homologous end-joining DNA ligase [Nonomuraea cavernae]MCA2190763.1 non-homologous end-joining DNA ligase [Nonomuraea cavernae]GGO82412.1 ATP-dependent DNA ligase [Nonomuraea cavernae]
MGRLPTYHPMLAQLGSLPPAAQDDAWSTEMKWDGVRALAYVEAGAVRLVSRTGRDMTASYPELCPMAGAVDGHDVVLDGEIIAFDDAGRPSFGTLAPRMQQRNPLKVAQLVRAVPVTYMIFDVLHVDDRSVVRLPYDERRELLERLVTPGFRWQTPVAFRGGSRAALAASRELGLEGVVVKRRTSPYRPGRRSPEWTKVKNVSHREVVIGGWKPGTGRRGGRIGSLLLGAHDPAGRLLYVGHVGTGFTDAMLADLRERLAPLERPDSPFTEPVPREYARDAHWVEPRLVGEVRYAEVTADGRLRHPSWRGLRPDKEPGRVMAADVRIDLPSAMDDPGSATG